MGLDTPDKAPKFDQIVEDGLELKRKSPHEFYMFCLDIGEMAAGGNPLGMRNTAFDGWENSDFAEVLDAIGGRAILEETAQTGSPRFYEEILQRFQARKKDSEYYDSIYELVHMAFGGNPYNLRRTYPGWTNDDFKRLLLDLDQEAALKFEGDI
jgi:hypothetical protein